MTAVDSTQPRRARGRRHRGVRFRTPAEARHRPDDNGTKKVNDDGHKVKITTTLRVRKLANARLSKSALEHRSWTKFGDAAGEDASKHLTMVSTEEILLERPRAPGSKADEPKAAGDPLSQIGKPGAVLMVCRTCGKKGDHWTSRCPYKNLSVQPEGFSDKADEPKAAGDPLSQIGKPGAVLMVCRTCGKKGDHWTSRCPYKDLSVQPEGFSDKADEPKATGDPLSQIGKPGAVLMVCRTCGKKGDHWTSRCPYKDLSVQPEGFSNKADEPKAAGDPLSQIGKPGAVLMVCRTCGKKCDHWTSQCPYKDLYVQPEGFSDKADEPKAAGDPLSQIGKPGAVLMVCRTCGKKGDHWTSRCPYKDLSVQPEGFSDKADEPKAAGDPLSQIGKPGAVLMVCRTCGKKGDHWTSRCPYKDLSVQPEGFSDKADEPKAAGDPLSQIGKPGAVLMVCRTCGKKGDHWTSRCPYKDLSVQPEGFSDKADEPKAAGDPLSQIGKPGAVLMVCRTCGKKGDHWTSRCPYKDLSVQPEGFSDKADEPKAAGDPLSQIGKPGAVLMMCRTCGKKGDHWTSRCPYKDLSVQPEGFSDKADEPKAAGDPLSQIGKPGAVLMVCRTCGKKGDHWTSRCPYKDLSVQPEGFSDKPPTSETSAAASGGTSSGAYVPPTMRPGAERTGTDMRRRNDVNSVRVTNLSEDTREPDLLELFKPFGGVTRVYVAVDQKTGLSRGFGFVNFANKEDAQRAINKLNGYGYDSLILRVEWATPRTT